MSEQPKVSVLLRVEFPKDGPFDTKKTRSLLPLSIGRCIYIYIYRYTVYIQLNNADCIR